jgi:hypothetical protein
MRNAPAAPISQEVKAAQTKGLRAGFAEGAGRSLMAAG